MANKNGAKTAIDNAVVAIKADIDTILPIGVNIKDGTISFGPIAYSLILDAEGSIATADALVTAITANLTTALRPYEVRYRRRIAADGMRKIFIVASNVTFEIINF